MGLFKDGNTLRGSHYFYTVILLGLFFFCTALPVNSYAGFMDWLFPSKKETPKEKVRTPSIQAPKTPEKIPPLKSFTIAGIEPGPHASGLVKINFTEVCYADNLRDKLRIFPPVQIDWYNSRFSDKTLSLKGQFKYDQEYTVTIPEGVECMGSRYVKTINTFKMPDLESGIQLADPDTVIERDSRQMLHVKVTNVEELLFHGLRVPPLVAPQVIREMKALTEAQKTPGPVAAANPDSGRSSKKAPATVSFEKIREFIEKKYEEIQRIPDARQDLAYLIDPPSADSQMFFPGKVRNKTQDFSIPLSFRKDREKGAVELIQLRSNKASEKAEAVRVYRITDLGISYKLSKSSLLLWVTSLNSGKPVPDVSLVAVLKDSDILPLGKTDEKGVLYIKGSHLRPRFSVKQNAKLEPSRIPIRDIEFIVAGSPTDSTYVEINEGGNIRPDWVSQITSVKDKTSLSKGRLFTERGIYRPGQKVFFKGVVRAYKEGSIKPPSKLNPKITIINSKNEEIYSKEIPLSKFGTVNDSLEIKPFFPLGTYTATMKYSDEQRPVQNAEMMPAEESSDEEDESGPYEGRPSADVGTAVATFEVQEFVAPRHFVELSFKKEKKVDESYVNLKKEIDLLVCNISGVYYAGGPVKHGKVRWKASYRGTDFRFKDYKNYTFGSVI